MELDWVNSDKPYSHIRASMYVLSMPCGHGTCSSLFPRVVVVSETSAFAFLPSSPGSLAYISFLNKHGSASLAVKPSLSMKYFCLISLHHTYPAYDSVVLQVNFWLHDFTCLQPYRFVSTFQHCFWPYKSWGRSYPGGGHRYTSSSIFPTILVRRIIASRYYLANKLPVRLLDGRSTCFVCPCTQTLGKRSRCILVHECWSSPLHTSVT